MDKKINLTLFFEHFPAFNQSYISDMVDLLDKNAHINLNITCLKKSTYYSNLKIKYLPKYIIRRIYERFYWLLFKNFKYMSYAEIKWLKSGGDIIHIHHSFLFKHIKNIIQIKKTNRPKVIITLRGSDTYVKPWFDERWSNFYKLYGNKLDAFIVQGLHQKMYLQKWGVSEDKIHIIPSSIKHSNSIPRIITNKEKIKIVSSFRMCWEKNIDGNIRVIRNLIDQGFNIEYDIYGFGNDIGQVYFLIDKYNLHNYVNIKGKIDNEVYKKDLKNYDFYLQLSVSESLSISVIEAQSNGVPAIISNSGGMPETILNEKSGFSVPYYDVTLATKKLIYLIENEKVYYKFSTAAIDNINKKFINAIEVDSHINLYNKLLNRKNL